MTWNTTKRHSGHVPAQRATDARASLDWVVMAAQLPMLQSHDVPGANGRVGMPDLRLLRPTEVPVPALRLAADCSTASDGGTQSPSTAGYTPVHLSEANRSEAQNAALVWRLVHECINAKRIDLLPEIFATDVAVQQSTPSDILDSSGIDEVAEVLGTYHRVFPDLRMTIEDLIAMGDRVVLRWVARGTHSAEFHGYGATGRGVTFGGIDIFRVEAGKIVESWRNDDLFGLLEQLGDPPPVEL